MEYKKSSENSSDPFVQDKTPEYYRNNAEKLAAKYASGDTGIDEIVKNFAPPGSSVLDVGCGTGRDLEKLRADGYVIQGVDPSQEMLTQAETFYPELKSRLKVSSLPDLHGISGPFRTILCSAVFQHIKDRELYESFRNIYELTEDQGIFILTVPGKYPGIDQLHKVDRSGRLFILRSAEQYRFLLERQGFCLVDVLEKEDALQREGVTWVSQVYRKEAQKTKTALNIIDAILREEAKTTTYKFALLRALAETASYSYKTAEWYNDGNVGVNIDLLTEKWIQYYWPLMTCDPLILQGQNNRSEGKSDLVFRPLLMELAESFGPGGYLLYLSSQAGGEGSQDQTPKVRELKKIIGQALIKGPIFYSGDTRSGEKPFSYRQGKLIMKAKLWTEFVLMGRWIEDSIILRWAEFTASLPYNKARGVTPSQVLDLLLSPREAKRDVRPAETILRRFPSHQCVWTGKTVSQWYIDHALPFSLWRNNDIWNLFPSDSRVNNAKRDRLPSRRALNEAKSRIFHYWEIYYESVPALFLHQAGRFCGEGYTGFSRAVQDTLFSTLNEAVEAEAARQTPPRWTP